MADTSIGWTDSSWNPCVGCTMVSPGCAHCYAERMAHRLACMAQADIAAGRNPGKKRHYLKVVNMETGRWNNHVEPVPEALSDPFGWKKPRMIFVNSMSDLFHKDVPVEFIDDVFTVMYDCHWHTFQVLTKRPDRMAEYLSDPNLPVRIACNALRRFQKREPEKYSDGLLSNADMLNDVRDSWPLPNVWIGTSVEDQPRADERIPHLLHCPAAVRFLSVEPMLGPVELTDQQNCWLLDDYSKPRIHWVIVGGESGPGARPFDLRWARSIIGQCREAGVACFVKQLGSRPFDSFYRSGVADQRVLLKHGKGEDPTEWPADLRVQEWPQTTGATA